MFLLSTNIQLTFEYLLANENYIIVFCFLIIQLEANLIFFLLEPVCWKEKSPNQETGLENGDI